MVPAIIMTGIMLASFRRAVLAPSLAAPAVVAWSARAAADHGTLPPIVRWSPLAVGVIAFGLTLATGLAIAAIVILLRSRRAPE